MAFRPILFSTPMIEAILSGRKTQTRRTINPQTPEAFTKLMYLNAGIEIEKYKSELLRVDSKYRKDDVLWVRETWNRFDSELIPYVYKATDLKSCGHSWKPSIHMPFDAARIFLKVKNIRIERLNDISESDSIAEGVCNFIDEEGKHQFYVYPVKRKGYTRTVMGLAGLCNTFISKGIFGLIDPAKFSFESLWESINGMGSWEINPWVWVYDFEVLKATPGTCIFCGCTDFNCKECIKKTGIPCHWTNKNCTVCSACRSQKKHKS